MVSGAQARAVAAARRELRREARGDRGVADAVARARAASTARDNRVTKSAAVTEFPAQLRALGGTGANCVANSATSTEYPAQVAAAIAPSQPPIQRSAA